ncbi:pentapeptide repeat-containing protein [Kibdelosporangium philippinense]|uniref:Pentapeptide repeat-containing protein n=1 Tax=Kibdelosporangium philippinense TaxID=211113 RepID=A0ABS8ZNV2_9PSEU|nr:pentapeptide repeat-containing protein [Kibdelosporangium philippinense]MCE7009439.1 pentapeptide repeat-containing protein [Kibdelosporangium philippinense]
MSKKPARVLSNRSIAISAALVVLLAAGAAWLLLAQFGGGSEADRARLDAIRTVGSLVLGAGGAIALLLAARRQQTAERDLAQKEQVQLHAEQDAAERRITELYLKAVDQLGSDKAPVRLAALHALERVGQGNPAQRQTIVDVICAYLRMPYSPPTTTTSPRRLGYRRPIRPGHPLPARRPMVSVPVADQPRQEREVRLTAQRILTTHLQPEQSATFWANMNIDLSGATLIDFSLIGGKVGKVWFDEATFIGFTTFDRTVFTGEASFQRTAFADEAWFAEAKFADGALFLGAKFKGHAMIADTEFAAEAAFNQAEFAGGGSFAYTKFADPVSFDNAKFGDTASFANTQFADDAWFEGVVFAGEANFSEAEFAGADFSESEFAAQVTFEGAWVRTDVEEASWPEGWTAVAEERPDRTGTWAKLVRAGA